MSCYTEGTDRKFLECYWHYSREHFIERPPLKLWQAGVYCIPLLDGFLLIGSAQILRNSMEWERAIWLIYWQHYNLYNLSSLLRALDSGLQTCLSPSMDKLTMWKSPSPSIWILLKCPLLWFFLMQQAHLSMSNEMALWFMSAYTYQLWKSIAAKDYRRGFNLSVLRLKHSQALSEATSLIRITGTDWNRAIFC